MTTLGLRGAIVFDSHPAHSAPHPHRSEQGHLEVIISPTNIDADTFLLELLTTKKDIKNTTLVTSDNEVAFAAKPLGVSLLGVKDFLKLLHNKELHSRKSNDKPNLECRFQLDRLLEIFEQKYHEES